MTTTSKADRRGQQREKATDARKKDDKWNWTQGSGPSTTGWVWMGTKMNLKKTKTEAE